MAKINLVLAVKKFFKEYLKQRKNKKAVLKKKVSEKRRRFYRDKRWGELNADLVQCISNSDFMGISFAYFNMADFLAEEGTIRKDLFKLAREYKIKGHIRRIEEIRSTSFNKNVCIMTAKDNRTCAYCKRLEEIKIPMESVKAKVEEMVNSCHSEWGQTGESWCRCGIVVDVEGV